MLLLDLDNDVLFGNSTNKAGFEQQPKNINGEEINIPQINTLQKEEDLMLLLNANKEIYWLLDFYAE